MPDSIPQGFYKYAATCPMRTRLTSKSINPTCKTQQTSSICLFTFRSPARSTWSQDHDASFSSHSPPLRHQLCHSRYWNSVQ